MLSLLENITGQSFDQYLSVHSGLADVFSLTKNGWANAGDSPQHASVLNALAPYYIKTIHVNRWFCHCVPNNYDVEVYLFRFTPESKRILLAYYDSIFYVDSVWSKPEDLCFFNKNKLISGSVTHEKICFEYSENIKLPGLWETIQANVDEQICIPE